MVQEYSVEGYENFKEKVTELSLMEINGKKPRIFVYFTGSRMEDGNSWCPDCVKAEPIVKEALKNLNDDDIFLFVEVGKLEFWKSSKCPFRTDENIRLFCVPTLMLWGSDLKLEEDECWCMAAIEVLFDEGKQAVLARERSFVRVIKNGNDTSEGIEGKESTTNEGEEADEDKVIRKTHDGKEAEVKSQ